TPGATETNLSQNLCEGDSIFIAGVWQKQAGVFTEIFDVAGNCDSVVTTTVELLSSDSIFIFSETCDPSMSGIFTDNYFNTNGCDSVVITTVELLLSDSVFIFSETCD